MAIVEFSPGNVSFSSTEVEYLGIGDDVGFADDVSFGKSKGNIDTGKDVVYGGVGQPIFGR